MSPNKDFAYRYSGTIHTISKGPMARKKWSREQYYNRGLAYASSVRVSPQSQCEASLWYVLSSLEIPTRTRLGLLAYT